VEKGLAFLHLFLSKEETMEKLDDKDKEKHQRVLE
jgi:hypothetical protein